MANFIVEFRGKFNRVCKAIPWRLHQFSKHELGTSVVTFAIVAPVLMTIVGATIDYGMLAKQRGDLQAAVDAGALAGAEGLALSDAKRTNVSAVVAAVVNSYVKGNLQSKVGSEPPSVVSVVHDNPLEVEVAAKQKARSYFGNMFGLAVDKIAASATARVVGQPNICVLGLNPSANKTISLEHNARVTGRNCSVFSNSSHTNALVAKNSATLVATTICSVGGKTGGPGNFMPAPLTGCPTFDDPLASRPEPTVGACDASKPTVVSADQDLFPGVYCGGLTVLSGVRVFLNPGIYIFKDGPLNVTGASEFRGQNVGLYFTGTNVSMTLEPQTTISLTAPNSGVMAGLLMFSSRSLPSGKASPVFKILSDNARVLLGTIYLPTAELHVDAGSPIADQSAYTAIVADTMRLYGGPHLVLNTNYNQTDIPVPAGIKGVGQPVSLVK